MPRALLSVSDKRGIAPFAAGLVRVGWDLISTGGTAAALRDAGVPVVPVEQVTDMAELLDGRVKTLHPAIHAALLARRDEPADMAALSARGIQPIDLVAVNLYPFRQAVSQPDVAISHALENIDIGGPTMLRAAAKNFPAVLPVVDPTDYERVLGFVQAGDVPLAVRRELAAKVFGHIAEYDAAIARFLTPESRDLPARMTRPMERLMLLRYGENPDQRGALYVEQDQRGMRDLTQRQGKELSFNNLLDIDAGMWAVSAWPSVPACTIIKHSNPCGIAVGTTAVEAFRKALASDPVSAFGSVVAFNTVVTEEAALAMRDLFVEVVVAPRFQDEALAAFAGRKNLRVVELPLEREEGLLDLKGVRGGVLVQDRASLESHEHDWTVVTDQVPTDAEMRDLRFAWTAVGPVKSNAILLARNEMSIGIGAGQMSRVDSVHLAIYKARRLGHDPTGSVLASDGFFPFPDGVEEAADAGVRAIIQPGGSIRDPEVIAAANRLGLAMIFTGRRLFRH